VFNQGSVFARAFLYLTLYSICVISIIDKLNFDKEEDVTMRQTIALTVPYSNTHRTAEENLGLGYLAATLRLAGFRVEIIDGWLENLSHEEIVNCVVALPNLLLVGISAYRSSLENAARLVRDIKNRISIPIVAGGYGPTFFDEDFLAAGFDYVLRGEGEKSLSTLACVLSESGLILENVPGISMLSMGKVVRGSMSHCVEHLDSLPFPARDTVYSTIHSKNPISVSTSRGCLGSCLFCAVSAFARQHDGTRWRERSVKNIVNELEMLHQKYGAKCFKFVDDSFLEPPRGEIWAESFSNELYLRGLTEISFRTQVRADRLTNKIVEILSGCGWFATGLGVENWSVSALKRMNKGASIADNFLAMEYLERHGVYVQMGMILFDWDTTLVELKENLGILKDLSWPVTKGIFTETYVSAGTPNERLLLSRSDVQQKRSVLGHLEYRPCVPEVDVVYEALRLWHRSHSSVYDHAINPITAPKAIDRSMYRKYHDICRRLYSMDLVFFERVLEMAEHGISKLDVQTETMVQVSDFQTDYERIEREIVLLDQVCGIGYSAYPNPFLGET